MKYSDVARTMFEMVANAPLYGHGMISSPDGKMRASHNINNDRVTFVCNDKGSYLGSFSYANPHKVSVGVNGSFRLVYDPEGQLLGYDFKGWEKRLRVGHMGLGDLHDDQYLNVDDFALTVMIVAATTDEYSC